MNLRVNLCGLTPFPVISHIVRVWGPDGLAIVRQGAEYA
jgi:hypothetical protein